MEFIFENPIFIIIFIGYIISFFMKNKKNHSQQQKGSLPQGKPTARQIFQEIQERIPQLDTSMFEEQQRLEEEQAHKLEQESLERQRLAEAKMNEFKEQQQLAEKRAEQIRTVAKAPGSQQISSAQKEFKQALAPSKKQLIDGIIWSEIIGPPRALNPHKSVKNNK